MGQSQARLSETGLQVAARRRRQKALEMLARHPEGQRGLHVHGGPIDRAGGSRPGSQMYKLL